ncbi:MAG: transcriptional regulator [Nevskia sp.]|nr:transcriptional regulator [Nevskia sp.]
MDPAKVLKACVRNAVTALSNRILLVEDDRKLARLVVEYLRANGLDAVAVHDGIEGAARATAERWDLVILDVMLPQLNGFEVLKRARAASDVAVLMLTARGGEDDRIYGLEHGADDYLPKTASSRELLARVRALLRRTAPASQPTASTEPLVVGELCIDVASRSARLDGKMLTLTPVEFDLLLSLAQHKGRVRSREQLMEQIRDRQYEAFDRSIDVHIAALRRKLRDDSRLPRYIRTVRTVGYLLVDPATAPT